MRLAASIYAQQGGLAASVFAYGLRPDRLKVMLVVSI